MILKEYELTTHDDSLFMLGLKSIWNHRESIRKGNYNNQYYIFLMIFYPIDIVLALISAEELSRISANAWIVLYVLRTFINVVLIFSKTYRTVRIPFYGPEELFFYGILLLAYDVPTIVIGITGAALFSSNFMGSYYTYTYLIPTIAVFLFDGLFVSLKTDRNMYIIEKNHHENELSSINVIESPQLSTVSSSEKLGRYSTEQSKGSSNASSMYLNSSTLKSLPSADYGSIPSLNKTKEIELAFDSIKTDLTRASTRNSVYSQSRFSKFGMDATVEEFTQHNTFSNQFYDPIVPRKNGYSIFKDDRIEPIDSVSQVGYRKENDIIPTRPLNRERDSTVQQPQPQTVSARGRGKDPLERVRSPRTPARRSPKRRSPRS